MKTKVKYDKNENKTKAKIVNGVGRKNGMTSQIHHTDSEVDSRRARILEVLGERGKVRVSDLATAFSVSEATIRNDLNEMERQNLLERIHGGAMLSERGYHTLPLQERMRTNETHKKRIAEAAAAMIRDGESLMLSSGSTSLHVAMALRERRNLLVLTNSLPVVSVLGGNPGIRLILLGGMLEPESQYLYGDDTVSQLSRYRFDKLIFSGDGISFSAGVTTWHLAEVEVNRRMFANCQQCIVVADHSKVGRASLVGIDDLTQVDRLVTDVEADEQEVRQLQNRGIDVSLV